MRKVSGKLIIDRIYSRFKPSDSDWVGDAWDDIADAIEGIGYHTGFVDNHRDLTVANNRVDIPREFVEVHYVEYKDKRLPLGGDLSGSNIASTAEDTIELDPYRVAELKSLVQQWEDLQEWIDTGGSPEQIEEWNYRQEVLLERIKKLTGELHVNTRKDTILGEYYLITEDEQIVTSFSSGDIVLYGNEFPVDKDGIPLIVDTYKYREACFFKVASLMLMKGYKHPTLTYELADAKWEFFRAQASNEPRLMGVSKLDRFARFWTRFKFDPYEGSTFLKYTEQ